MDAGLWHEAVVADQLTAAQLLAPPSPSVTEPHLKKTITSLRHVIKTRD